MAQERLILAIGRIERALSRLEQTENPSVTAQKSDKDDSELAKRHEKLKSETRAILGDIDHLISQAPAEDGGASHG